MTNSEIGSRIKYVRNLRNATLDDIAKKVGVAKSTIQRYENGKINSIKIPVVESIALALNVNPSWMIGTSDVMETPLQIVPEIMQYYDLLNDAGKQEAKKRIMELTELSRYTKASANKSKRTDSEISEDLNAYFMDAQKARKYLHSQKYLAAFEGTVNDLSNSDAIKIANEIKKNSADSKL